MITLTNLSIFLIIDDDVSKSLELYVIDLKIRLK